MTKTQNRDANHLRWQKSTNLGIRDFVTQGLNIGKWSTGNIVMGLLL